MTLSVHIPGLDLMCSFRITRVPATRVHFGLFKRWVRRQNRLPCWISVTGETLQTWPILSSGPGHRVPFSGIEQHHPSAASSRPASLPVPLHTTSAAPPVTAVITGHVEPGMLMVSCTHVRFSVIQANPVSPVFQGKHYVGTLHRRSHFEGKVATDHRGLWCFVSGIC